MSKLNIPPQKIPVHAALIMDGNLRWAKARGVPYIEGLRQGAKAIKPIVEQAGECGIQYITFWALSTENWKRGPEFTHNLFGVFREFLKQNELFDELITKGGKLHIWGDTTEFPADIQAAIQENLSREPTEKKIDVNFCLNYGGRAEILRAVKNILKDGLTPEEISEEKFSQYLYSCNQPDPDFIIRTSGEKRLSGFMPWQGVYAEFYFASVFWPDFTPEEFDKALLAYSQRERRFGGRPDRKT